MKKNRVKILAIIGVLVFIVAGAVYFLGLFRAMPVMRSGSIPPEYSLLVTSDRNFRQGTNQCAPYAASIFLTASQSTGNTNPDYLVEALPWKLPRGYTHPRALEALLQQFDIHTVSLDAGSLSDEEKIRFLRQQIASGIPVILLTYMYGYQHYITLLGYDAIQEEFYVYDPVFTRGEAGMTLDENGELPGNRNIPYAQLLSDWSQGGIAGFYDWYALTAR